MKHFQPALLLILALIVLVTGACAEEMDVVTDEKLDATVDMDFDIDMDISISDGIFDDPEYYPSTENVLMQDMGETAMGGYLERDSVQSIHFVSSLEGMPDNAWDVSAFQNGSVYAWVEYADNRYILYIGANGPIVANQNCAELFENYTEVEEIDFGNNFDTSLATDMTDMFAYCENLTKLDVHGFDTGMTMYMSGMFWCCSALEEIDVSGFDTSAVESMYGMFGNCNKLAGLDLGSFDTSCVTDMSEMFSNCERIGQLDVSGFDTSCVQNMNSMFAGCGSLEELDLTSFDTSCVTDMSNMFWNCEALTSLDLSNFDMSSVENISYMFEGCEQLSTLILDDPDFSSVTSMDSLFERCENLNTADFAWLNGGAMDDAMAETAQELLDLYLLGDYGYSRQQLLEMLGEAGCREEIAAEVLDGNAIDWNEQAVYAAENLKDYGYEYDDLIAQLEFDQFTHEEAVYAADAVFNSDASA